MHLHTMLKSALLLLSGTALYAAPVITRNTTIPSEVTQIPHAICGLKNGGYLIGGYSVDSTGQKEGLLIRTDGGGTLIGSIKFPLKKNCEITAVTQAFDGNYVVCGYISTLNYGGENYAMMKLDTNGNCRWYREFGNDVWDRNRNRPSSIIQTADSGFAIIGKNIMYTWDRTWGAFQIDTATSLLKINKTGEILGYKVYNYGFCVFRSVKQTDDGGFILTGSVRGTQALYGGKDAFLLKVDLLGQIKWYQVYGGSGDEIGNSVDLTTEGGYVIAGSTTSYGNGLQDAFVLKTDSKGHPIWNKTFGGTDSDEALGIITKDDTTYILAGNMRSFSADSVATLYQLNSKGDSVWSARLQGVISQAGTPLRKSEADLFTFCYSHVNNGDTSIGIVAESNTIRDIDGNIYTVVKIGKQLWTVENLRTTRYNDGTPIAHITGTSQWSETTGGAYCFYNNSTDSAYRQKWGALYNWYAVGTKKLAPKGWRVPTNADWDTLENYLIANGYNWDGTRSGNKIGKSMATQTDWTSNPFAGTIGIDQGKNNASGFSALPGGYLGSGWLYGKFDGYSSSGHWWSATETEYGASFAWSRNLEYISQGLHRSNDDKSWGFSVRLLRD